MAESTQHKLSRVRPPRVQITYDVQIGNAIEKKELPLVIGVLADLSGNNPDPDKPQPRLKERGFIEIDRDNFDAVMSSLNPRLKLAGGVNLTFQKMEDFEPENVVNQVPALKQLLDARKRLSDLIAKLDGNEDLDQQLQKIIGQTDVLQKIKADADKTAKGAN